ncbi:MAG: hypothetical protein FWH27_14380 [Planctomycetaceae bacterium]|nr:hypothetical protein [Planctomycetaceae bacterium]
MACRRRSGNEKDRNPVVEFRTRRKSAVLQFFADAAFSIVPGGDPKPEELLVLAEAELFQLKNIAFLERAEAAFALDPGNGQIKHALFRILIAVEKEIFPRRSNSLVNKNSRTVTYRRGSD